METGIAGLTLLELGAGLLLLGIGIGLGLLLGRGKRATRERVQALEGELRETRGQLDAHREAVTKHFTQTSELFGDLTRQYTSLYSHLAEGARDLCDDIPELGRGFSEALLPGSGGSLTGEDREIASEREASEPMESQKGERDSGESPKPETAGATPPETERPTGSSAS